MKNKNNQEKKSEEINHLKLQKLLLDRTRIDEHKTLLHCFCSYHFAQWHDGLSLNNTIAFFVQLHLWNKSMVLNRKPS